MSNQTFPVMDDAGQGFEVGKVTIPDGIYQPAGGGVVNNGWYEEKIGTNFYRWTQVFTFSVTGSPNFVNTNGFMVFQGINLPALPTGGTFTSTTVTLSSYSFSSTPSPYHAWIAKAGGSNTQFVLYTNTGGNLPLTASIVAVCYGTKP